MRRKEGSKQQAKLVIQTIQLAPKCKMHGRYKQSCVLRVASNLVMIVTAIVLQFQLLQHTFKPPSLYLGTDIIFLSA